MYPSQLLSDIQTTALASTHLSLEPHEIWQGGRNLTPLTRTVFLAPSTLAKEKTHSRNFKNNYRKNKPPLCQYKTTRAHKQTLSAFTAGTR